MSDKQEKIYLKGISQAHPMSAIKFLEEYEALVKQGYTLHPNPKGAEIPCFVGFPRCVMVTKEYADALVAPVKEETIAVVEETVTEPEVVAPESAEITFNDEIAEQLESAKTKVEIQAVAELMGVTIPEDKKVPKAMKQYLINLTK